MNDSLKTDIVGPDDHRVPGENEWLIFVDEAGSEELDLKFDALVLMFVLMPKYIYRRVVSEFKPILLNHFPNDGVVLHENDLRYPHSSPLYRQFTAATRSSFVNELSAAIATWEIDLIASVIDKAKWRELASPPAESMYQFALRRGLERVVRFTCDRGFTSSGDLVLESRGEERDRELYPVLSDYLNHASRKRGLAPISWRFAPKHAGILGLQLADLFARPVGLHVLRPGQPNRAFDTIRGKFQREGEMRAGTPRWRLDNYPPGVPLPKRVEKW
jgi:hypothetical protein